MDTHLVLGNLIADSEYYNKENNRKKQYVDGSMIQNIQ